MVTPTITMLLWIPASKRTLLSHLSWMHLPTIASGSCNAPAMKSLAEDYKLSAWGKQPFITFSFCCHLIWFISFAFVFVFVVFFRTCAFYSSLGERSPMLHQTLCHSFSIVFLATLGTMCHFSLGVRKTLCLLVYVFFLLFLC